MGWYIALGIVVLLALLPLGASVKYDAGGAMVKAIAGPIRIKIFPRPKKLKKEKPAEKELVQAAHEKPKSPTAEPERKQGPQAEKPHEPQKEKGGKLTDFLPLVKVALNLLGDLRRKLRVKQLDLKLILAGDDPCDLGVNYGRAWAALGNLMPQLERFFVIKKRDVQVECDFTETETKVIVRMDVTITLGCLLALAVVYGIRVIKEFLKIQNKRKGGAVNEPKSS